MKLPIPLTSILLIFLAAGCIGSSQVVADRGLTMTEFIATPGQVTANEPVLFEVEVQNIGGTTARDVQVDFFGVENQWRDDTGSIIDSTLTKDLGDLKPPEPARNVPSLSRLVAVNVMPPEIPQGITTTLRVEARASYDYTTNGFIDIPAVSEDEYRRRQINQQGIDFPVTVQNSAGPIHMTMDTKYAPVRVDTTDDEENVQTWPLRIMLTNVGDGFPITPEDDERIRGAGGRIEGTIRLLGNGAEFEDCLGETGGTQIDLDSTDIPLRIRETNQAVIPCTISIDKGAWGSTPIDTIKLIFEFSYRYYVAQTASVTVVGR